MNEPTVLDYFKSIFKDWKSFTAFLRAWADRADTTQMIETSPLEEIHPQNVESSTAFPWRSLLALLIALAAQRMFEPPDRNAILGVSLYIAALGLVIWAFVRGGLKAAPLPASQVHADPLTVRGGLFLLSMIFGIAAFLLMWDLNFLGVDVPFWPTQANRFNGWNITVWALAIFLFIRAFWLPEPQSLLKRIVFSLSHIRITRWGLLVLAVVALTLFFRFHRLSTVVPEMTSDHAEKLWDVFDITNGEYSIFFPRNTGREPLYIYLSALLTPFTGISFLTIKLASVIGGLLMLPYLYLLGKELGSKRIGLLAVAFAGIAYWPIVIERFALRISFYPLFVAPVLYYLIRGLRRQQRNDFILAGIALGLGLNGYMPFRIMPFAVVAIVVIYLLHVRGNQIRKQTLLWLGLLALTAWVFFIPLARYAVDDPDMFGFRALSRLGSIERPLPGPAWQIFLGNLWNAAKEFNWNNGGIWVHSIPYRPALDVVSGVLFLTGVLLLLARYLRSHRWTDLVILLAIPMTQMPSILSLAFPSENPSLNRAAGAIVPAFLLVGIGLDGLMAAFGSEKKRAALGWSLAGILLVFSSIQNYDLVFRQYNQQYTESAWNTSEIGAVMTDAMQSGVPAENVWVVPYPHWVDTRLPPIWAGLPGWDIAKPRENLPDTLAVAGPKVFMVSMGDAETIALLQTLYPLG
ncbi:MAG TPA: glycosyltransferase family 39 protein, partial [Anaerolineales bacterium]|nr:glycosyltransferase family 39 protein [Anaerolineales bacterium]